MRILFYTFPEGHLVSDKEFERLKKGFAKIGMELVRWHKDKGDPPESDLIMVKGWSHRHHEIPNGRPLVYYSIGTEWKVDQDLEMLNEPIQGFYDEADAVVHVSEYCRRSHEAVFGPRMADGAEKVIIPACEPNLASEGHNLHNPLKLATTCVPRPVKRVEELERLCKKFNVELIPAYGGVSDFSYYRDCDGFISLSRKEGMPNTVLEAMSWGLPCIVTNYGGSKEAVGDAGIVIRNDPEDGPWDPDRIEPVDDQLFEDAIHRFIHSHDKLRIKVRERIRSELNDYVTACHFKEVFESIL